jgi:hypothetical protein
MASLVQHIRAAFREMRLANYPLDFAEAVVAYFDCGRYSL